jgi:NDP-sugar pyrophosphorylase family protein
LTLALIMAGGRGERMRASGASVPKPLVSIRGVPLLEHNLLRLLNSGFLNVVVAVPSHSPKVADFVRTRGKLLADPLGAKVRLFEETEPLGNIGAAAELETGGNDLLIVFADNLTSLDLTALVRHHCETDSALTAAVHLEPFPIPYGEVEIHDGAIAAYREKPEHRILISTGLFVLAPAARLRLPRGQRTEVAWLVNRLLAEGEKVSAFQHDAPWIDVNDSSAVDRAERLVAKHSNAFECRDAPSANHKLRS